MSPAYKEVNYVEDDKHEQFKRVYPNFEPSSVLDSINLTDQS